VPHDRLGEPRLSLGICFANADAASRVLSRAVLIGGRKIAIGGPVTRGKLPGERSAATFVGGIHVARPHRCVLLHRNTSGAPYTSALDASTSRVFGWLPSAVRTVPRRALDAYSLDRVRRRERWTAMPAR